MLSRKQVYLLWIGVVLVLAMAVFPPWEFRPVLRYAMTAPAGYSLIFLPPKLDNVRVDVTRIGIQWFAVAVIIGAAIVTQQKGGA
jgi:hypothetical protein